jgi:hypothetical protein
MGEEQSVAKIFFLSVFVDGCKQVWVSCKKICRTLRMGRNILEKRQKYRLQVVVCVVKKKITIDWGEGSL